MKSLRELYRIGRGPSSSHTMGPEHAAYLFLKEYPQADRFRVVLFGSLAKTGAGHGTDKVLKNTLPPGTEIVIDTKETNLPHPNTLDFYAYRDGSRIGFWRVISIGGGTIKVEGSGAAEPPEVYALNTFEEIKAYCKKENLRIYEYVEHEEGPEIREYLNEVWQCMKQSVEDGLHAEGTLPGGLGITRKAKFLFNQKPKGETPENRENRIVCAYAYAVSEQNADSGQIVTAPTCGSCGVVPAVLYYMQVQRGFPDTEMLKALAAAGIIGNLVKTNASISGAECGCQAEIGTACSMASAGLAELFGMDIDQIEYAAEVAMEHHLGLTCDPVKGLVQIPCIERNAVAAMRAVNSLSLASFLTYTRKISFDTVVQTMYETGRDISKIYKETGEGGLAKLYK